MNSGIWDATGPYIYKYFVNDIEVEKPWNDLSEYKERKTQYCNTKSGITFVFNLDELFCVSHHCNAKDMLDILKHMKEQLILHVKKVINIL